MRFIKKRLGFLLKFNNMRLAHKFMLIYSVILGITIIVFATYLINVANNTQELNLVNDTQVFLREANYSIQREMDACYRVINSITSDYATISYLKDWDRSDKSDIINFKSELTYKFEQIMNLSPDIYQFRIFISNPSFPEIGSILYSDARLSNKQTIAEGLKNNPNGLWIFDHKEENYNTGYLERRNVVSVFKPLIYSNYRGLGIAEVTVLTKTFFRHLFSQPENENMLAFAIDNKGNIINDNNSAFAKKYNLDKSGIKELFQGHDIKGKSGVIELNRDRVSMNLIYDYVERIDCSICFVVTNESIISNLKNTRNVIIAVSLLALLILCVLIYVFTDILLIKMKQIIASMRKVESGRLDIRVDMSGQDEMSELAYHFNKMLEKIGDLISEVVKKQEAKKNAEINALFSQINSHFITNTLQNISMMAEIDSQFEIADAITSLGKLLRYSMKLNKESVRLKEEIDYIENYVNLMNLRFDYQIKLDIQIPKALMELEILKMLLQPAIENAIHYGIEPLGTGGIIRVCCYTESSNIVLAIIDDGVGMDEERLENVQQGLLEDLPIENNQEIKGKGIGLKNVNERIKLFYGNDCGIKIFSKKDSFTKVQIKLPIIFK